MVTVTTLQLSMSSPCPEEARFTRHPEAKPVVVGQRLVLECEAVGVPRPKFLWFKEKEPLPHQTSNRYIHGTFPPDVL